ncbi:MAG: hypothetical protein ABIQ88_01490 [Chitinophagaceae bacterium]
MDDICLIEKGRDEIILLISRSNLKMISMPPGRIKQLLSESETSKRLLSFLMEENIHLKNRLSEILKSDFKASLLAKLENYQTNFLHTDNTVTLLRNEVADFEKLLAVASIEKGYADKNLEDQLALVRHHIILAEISFRSLQSSFNHYLSNNI